MKYLAIFSIIFFVGCSENEHYKIEKKIKKQLNLTNEDIVTGYTIEDTISTSDAFQELINRNNRSIEVIEEAINKIQDMNNGNRSGSLTALGDFKSKMNESLLSVYEQTTGKTGKDSVLAELRIRKENSYQNIKEITTKKNQLTPENDSILFYKIHVNCRLVKNGVRSNWDTLINVVPPQK